MLEFDIAGQQYRAGKLNAIQQLHLSRRLAPIIPKLLPALAGMEEGAIDVGAIASAFDPLAGALAEMSDADCEYICGLCLGVVSRQQGEKWSSIWANKSLMFDDIDLAAMLQIVVKVIGDNLGSFTQGLLAKARAMSPAVP
jgi:hypothetical protein